MVPTPETKYPAMGGGVAICKRIVERHGGEISGRVEAPQKRARSTPPRQMHERFLSRQGSFIGRNLAAEHIVGNAPDKLRNRAFPDLRV